MQAFAHVPTVIAAFDNDINFLKLILTDIAGPQQLCFTIETHAPHIAESVCPNFLARALG